MRSVVALVVVSLGIGFYGLLSHLVLRRAKNKLWELEGARRGVPAILYFTTPLCGPCHTVQDPIIESLAAAYGRALQVIRVDATAQPDVADRWRVLSAPTLFVFDARGVARFLNNGITPKSQLERQLQAIGVKNANLST